MGVRMISEYNAGGQLGFLGLCVWCVLVRVWCVCLFCVVLYLVWWCGACVWCVCGACVCVWCLVWCVCVCCAWFSWCVFVVCLCVRLSVCVFFLGTLARAAGRAAT